MSQGLRELLESGRPAYNGWLTVPDGFAAEVMSTAPWDSLTIDLQHGAHDHASMFACLQAIGASAIPTLVRLSANDAAEAGRALDAGAAGVICPLVNGAAEAERFVRACRYPPRGDRSNGPVRAGLREPAGAYQRRADREVLCLAMIETTQALAALEEIAAVPGLDGLYVGPTDLSLSLGLAPLLDTEEPGLLHALDAVLAAAREHGLIPGVHTASAAYSRRMVARGFRLVTVGTDATYLATGARTALADARATGG